MEMGFRHECSLANLNNLISAELIKVYTPCKTPADDYVFMIS